MDLVLTRKRDQWVTRTKYKLEISNKLTLLKTKCLRDATTIFKPFTLSIQTDLQEEVKDVPLEPDYLTRGKI